MNLKLIYLLSIIIKPSWNCPFYIFNNPHIPQSSYLCSFKQKNLLCLNMLNNLLINPVLPKPLSITLTWLLIVVTFISILFLIKYFYIPFLFVSLDSKIISFIKLCISNKVSLSPFIWLLIYSDTQNI